MASPSEMKAAVGVVSSVRPVASAPQARLPVEEAAGASGAKVQPPGVAGAESAPSARQPGAAEVASDAEEAQPPEAAGVAWDAEAEPQQAVAAAEPDAVAAQLPGVAAEGLPDAEAQQPVARPDPSVRRPVAVPPSWRPEGHPRPWLAPRRAARSAHAMQRSRAASPSKRSWRAAGCEALS
jgi:hypothetical protein